MIEIIFLVAFISTFYYMVFYEKVDIIEIKGKFFVKSSFYTGKAYLSKEKYYWQDVWQVEKLDRFSFPTKQEAEKHYEDYKNKVWKKPLIKQ